MVSRPASNFSDFNKTKDPRLTNDIGMSNEGQAPAAKTDGSPPRGRLIKLALLTSIGIKVTAALIQFTAFPLAARTLGVERFGVYSMLAASLSWITMADIGIGPGLMLGIATSSGRGDRDAEAC